MSQPANGPVDRDRLDRARAAVGAATAPDPLEAKLTPGEERINLAEWARFIPPVRARIPEVRIGKRWYSTGWLIPITVVGLLIGIGLCQQLRTYHGVQSFITKYPGTGSFQPAVTLGFPLWLRILHFLNLIFMLFIIRAG